LNPSLQQFIKLTSLASLDVSLFLSIVLTMNQPANNNSFKPKQAVEPSAAAFEALVGDCMEHAARLTLCQIPRIPSDAVVHDNGCGTGASTAAIIEFLADPTAKVNIIGTDINDDALNLYRKKAADGHWPASAQNMNANALKFDDNTFTHSLGNLMIFLVSEDGIDAMKEVYRTLKPGGIALINSWAKTPTIAPLQNTSRAVRPPGTPLPRAGFEKWLHGETLRTLLQAAGFERDKIEISKQDVHCTAFADLKSLATMAWSFMGGTSTLGWQKEDEDSWDNAVSNLMEELKKTEGFEELGGDKCALKFVANIGIATK
jgi:ubiquinone/menaquinone biosynthesis C-methylase UbiE